MPQTAAPHHHHRTGVTTVTIQHSPAPARSDVATAAPDGTTRHRPFLLHGRVLTAGALAWAVDPWPWSASTPRATVRTWRSRCRSGLFQVGLLFLLRTLWRTQALGEGRLARAVLRFGGGRRRARDLLHRQRRSGPDRLRQGRLARARRLLAAVDARHVPHRHPDRDRRPMEGRDPLLADGRRELGRRHDPRDGDLRRHGRPVVGALHLVVGYAVLGVLVSRKRD